MTIILLTLMLWGCAGEPQKKPDEPTTPPPKQQQAAQTKGISLSLPSSSYNEAFNNAEHALAQFDWMQASVALGEVPDNALSPNIKSMASNNVPL